MANPANSNLNSFPVEALCIGTPVPFRDDELSAIAKSPIIGAVAIGAIGLAGDQQADRIHHGGVDKAIHHYPRDHYRFWRGIVGDLPIFDHAGAFGENISTHGLVETEVCLGDRFRLGTALIEVSHGRQPCWKQGHAFAQPKVTAMIVRNARCGWYYRVIEPGVAQAGDDLTLVGRVRPAMSVARMFGLVIGGGHKREAAALRDLAADPLLANAWRQRAEWLLAD